ncbi:MAG: hypothetical protein AAB352_02355 [Patescibacteria group bacterium]
MKTINKNLILIIVAFVLVIGGGLLLNQKLGFAKFLFSASPEGIILFYGEGCPHCKIVDDYIKANNIKDKVKFIELEVFNNKNNANILLAKAKTCNIDQSQIGVPFLWDGSKCLLGDQDVINFFKEKTK